MTNSTNRIGQSLSNAELKSGYSNPAKNVNLQV